MRVQRTRSSLPPRHAPLTRHPLGSLKERGLAVVTVCALVQAACLGTSAPQLVVRSGHLASLRGVSEVAVYAEPPDMALLKAELQKLNPAIVFTTADNAQVTIQFHEVQPVTVCVDCDEEPKPGLIITRLASANVERRDDRDHCLPLLLLADWEFEAYTRKALVRAFVRSLAPYLSGSGA
jgi:hypothetical protein